jgi:hypothetical protein
VPSKNARRETTSGAQGSKGHKVSYQVLVGVFIFFTNTFCSLPVPKPTNESTHHFADDSTSALRHPSFQIDSSELKMPMTVDQLEKFLGVHLYKRNNEKKKQIIF